MQVQSLNSSSSVASGNRSVKSNDGRRKVKVDVSLKAIRGICNKTFELEVAQSLICFIDGILGIFLHEIKMSKYSETFLQTWNSGRYGGAPGVHQKQFHKLIFSKRHVRELSRRLS